MAAPPVVNTSLNTANQPTMRALALERSSASYKRVNRCYDDIIDVRLGCAHRSGAKSETRALADRLPVAMAGALKSGDEVGLGFQQLGVSQWLHMIW